VREPPQDLRAVSGAAMSVGGCRTPPFNCRRLSEGAHSAPSPLILKGSRRDGFLKHRACQLQRIVLPRPSWPSCRSAPPTYHAAQSSVSCRAPSFDLRTAARSCVPDLLSRARRSAAVLLRHSLEAFTRRAAMTTSRGRGARSLRPSTVQTKALAFPKCRLRETRGTEDRASAERRVSTAGG